MFSLRNGNRLPDIVLLFVVLLLLLIGIVMVFSSSHIWAEYKYDDAFFYVKRQLLFVGFGLVCMFFLTFFPYYIWKKYVTVILFICFLFLVLVLIPGIGIVRGGAQSWIGIGAFSIQPSEFMKLGLIMFLAYYLAKHKNQIQSFRKGFLFPIFMIIISFGFIMLQPDLGTGVVLVITCVLMVFIAGANIFYFILLGIIGIIGFIFLILSAPYRISRITAYLNPWEDPLGDGFQIIQSLYSVGPGKLMCVGFDWK